MKRTPWAGVIAVAALSAGSAAAKSPCALPEICIPAKQDLACEAAWEPMSAQREINLSQLFDARYITSQVPETDPNWVMRIRPGDPIPTRWRVTYGSASTTLVHTAMLEEVVILECSKTKPILSVQRSAWVTRFHDQTKPDHKTTPEVRRRIKKDRFDLSKGKVSSPILKASDSRIAPQAPWITETFNYILKSFPTGVSFRKARNYFDPAFDEFLRFDTPVTFSYWTNVERTQLLLVNEKGAILARFRRSVSPFHYTDKEGRFTNSLEQELESAQGYLRGLEGTHEGLPLPLMEPDSYVVYKPLNALVSAALANPSIPTIQALHFQLKKNSWDDISKDLPLVEVGTWVKGFVDHVDAAYRLGVPTQNDGARAF